MFLLLDFSKNCALFPRIRDNSVFLSYLFTSLYPLSIRLIAFSITVFVFRCYLFQVMRAAMQAKYMIPDWPLYSPPLPPSFIGIKPFADN